MFVERRSLRKQVFLDWECSQAALQKLRVPCTAGTKCSTQRLALDSTLTLRPRRSCTLSWQSCMDDARHVFLVGLTLCQCLLSSG